MNLFEDNGAVISECGKHRYSLWRKWDPSRPLVMFIGVNPSRADAVYNDPTITRCIRFARDWGYGGLYFANLYSFRTPYPEVLVENLAHAYTVETDLWLHRMIKESERVVCAWGSWPFIDNRRREVLAMIEEPYCFGTNKDGNPKHPLYLKSSSITIPFAS